MLGPAVLGPAVPQTPDDRFEVSGTDSASDCAEELALDSGSVVTVAPSDRCDGPAVSADD